MKKFLLDLSKNSGAAVKLAKSASSKMGLDRTPRWDGSFLIRLIGRFGEPRVVITGKLRSYFSRVYDLAPGADHRACKGLNDRIEGSHRPARKREKLVGRFKSPRQAQRFLAAHDQINTVFRPLRYQLSVVSYRYARADAFDLWKGYTTEMSA